LKTQCTRPSIVILGGGFAGLSCAQALSSRQFDVRLIDNKPGFEFLPNIHEILSGHKAEGMVRLDLNTQMQALGHRFEQASVRDIDINDKQVLLDNGQQCAYDQLVVALGAVDADYGVEGVHKNAFPIKSAAQAAAIADRLDQLALSGRVPHVSIIGGGITGVEVLGELCRRPGRLDISLIEARDRLLPNTPASVDAHLRQRLAGCVTEVRCNTRVRQIRPKSLLLEDGSSLRTDLAIWTGGPQPASLLQAAGLAPNNAWAPVDACLRSLLQPDVWVVGDAAALPVPIAKQAYHAIDMGKAVAFNLKQQHRGKKPHPYKPAHMPQLVSVGALDCLLIAGPVVCASPSFAFGKELVFDLVLTQLDARTLPDRIEGLSRRALGSLSNVLVPFLTQPHRWPSRARIRLL
jgi:NADH dehydrogenase